MQRKPLILAGAAAAGALAIALALARAPSTSAISSAPADAPASGAIGPHGGTMLAQGALSAEIVLSEKPDDARLVVYPFVDGKPVEKDVTVAGALTRYDGSRVALQFLRSGAKYTSAQSIAKPHVFDASIDVKVGARSASFPLSRADGAIALTDEQIGAAKIGVARAGPAQVVASFQLPGEIKFNEDRTAHVVPRVAGIVERVAVSIGENVKAGQVLAVIASTDLADRRSELMTAERRLQAARTSYAREKTLWEERISAEQDYLQAQVQLREAEIATANARQKLAALNASAAPGALNRYELRAPFAGTIVEKHIAPGEAIAADANVFVVSDLSSVWAEMAVPAQRLNDVRVGRHASVSAAAFESKSSGPIAYVGALLGEQTRTASARVVLPNPDGAWRPGMFVNVTVDAGTQNVPVAVASDALQEIDGAPTVFVRTPKGFVAQAIEAGRRDDKSVEIVKGLAPGQTYAVANSFVLKSELGKAASE
ncbi:efflux RND transporter periplasmic adaptor subunit [Burkholderia thailandensis]|uniref:Heavy metal resistance protein CzcB n=1 Tax=Burkholderia thailandensis (strain ATCC 700388 / DSM 13276 / CCUG 48851 / CIP 106301 / E264) TaxID=271848 RepID=Q2T5H9_BURTA|nr:efflux RND transporter periplasmic adaptor subunit [Burkholderia thailandensis]ABC35727.1 heavy metal resistance protein CzcB [Burkholderia thailandensis E264]AHI76152.1 cobalt-zinc-cadmium resistance protein CzcB [Burkholderia thailandensis 2002721723]AHI80868.1 cobalt-zinc-cadmium resistance protein CzcB [Burkholderia thailandensis E444]AIC90873.1 cobalt-zinc-cadmium resistance protein CzcB [Burkholderia thailandensis USAMRU Malaysia \